MCCTLRPNEWTFSEWMNEWKDGWMNTVDKKWTVSEWLRRNWLNIVALVHMQRRMMYLVRPTKIETTYEREQNLKTDSVRNNEGEVQGRTQHRGKGGSCPPLAGRKRYQKVLRTVQFLFIFCCYIRTAPPSPLEFWVMYGPVLVKYDFSAIDKLHIFAPPCNILYLCIHFWVLFDTIATHGH